MSSHPKLLLLHGWTLDHSSMQAQQEMLSAHFHTINFDRPGYGANKTPPNLPDEHRYWLDYLNTSFGDEPVHLLGVSQGARIALRMAATAPNRIASVVVHGAAVDGLQSPKRVQPIPLDQFVMQAKLGELEHMRQAWLNHPMMREGLTPVQHRQIESIVSRYEGNDLLNAAGHDFTFATDLIAKLTTFQGPVLVSTGSLEAPERIFHAQWLRDNLKAVEYRSISGAGHLANFSHAEEYNRLVLEFYRSQGLI